MTAVAVAAVVGVGTSSWTPAARRARTAPRVAPPATLPVRYQVAVVHQRCPRPFSAKGVMVDSMETPQGDQVERMPPTSARAMAQRATTSMTVP
jgi:hypothetical protein